MEAAFVGLLCQCNFNIVHVFMSTKNDLFIVTCQHSLDDYLLWVRIVASVDRPWLQVHCHSSVGLPVDARWSWPDRKLRPRGDGRLDEGAVVVVARATSIIRGQRGRPWWRGYDVDRGGKRGGRVVVVGRRGGDGGGVVVAQLLPKTVFHVFVAQRRRVADLVL